MNVANQASKMSLKIGTYDQNILSKLYHDREFLRKSALLAALVAIPVGLVAANKYYVRQEDPDYVENLQWALESMDREYEERKNLYHFNDPIEDRKYEESLAYERRSRGKQPMVEEGPPELYYEVQETDPIRIRHYENIRLNKQLLEDELLEINKIDAEIRQLKKGVKRNENAQQNKLLIRNANSRRRRHVKKVANLREIIANEERL